MIATIAAAAGLEWTPPAGVAEVRVIRPGGARATLPPTTIANTASPLVAEVAIRRGDAVTVSYQIPGMEIRQAGMRALDNGAVGQTIRLRAGERAIDAIVTGPGAARATP
jgi:flagella basal body P-ring formation protein FlgA